jgi:hypothetical protein
MLLHKITTHTPSCGLISIATFRFACRSQVESSKTADLAHLCVVNIQRRNNHAAATARVFRLQFGALERSLVDGMLEDYDLGVISEFRRVFADGA